jgi:hypothetical protein
MYELQAARREKRSSKSRDERDGKRRLGQLAPDVRVAATSA